jgi:hypothetical protein
VGGAAPKAKTNIVPMRALADKEALAWLVGRGRIETSTAALARDWRWSTSKVKSRLDRWSAAGEIEVKPGLGGRTVITAPQQLPDTALAESIPTVVSGVAPAAPAQTSDEVSAAPTAQEPAAVGPASGDGAPVVNPSPVAVPAAVEPPPPVEVAAAAPTFAAAADTAIVHAPPVATIPAATTPVSASAVVHPRGSGFISFLAYVVAVALAGIAAYFSISGMIVLFPGAPVAIVVMGVVMETAKLVTVAFLAHQWRLLSWLSRLVLVTLVSGLAAINAAGVYSQLVAAHFGDRSATSAVETEAVSLAAKNELQMQTIADLDRRVSQIDAVIAEMVKRGRTSGALDAINTQRKQREALVGQRRHEAETLAALKSEAGAVAARTRQMEIEAAPIMYVAQLMGATTEQAIRMLILLMVLTCDPLAVALTAAASRPRAR